MGDTKRCARCYEEKPVEEFYRNARGSLRYCKPCDADYLRQWHAKHPEKKLEYQRSAANRSRAEAAAICRRLDRLQSRLSRRDPSP